MRPIVYGQAAAGRAAQEAAQRGEVVIGDGVARPDGANADCRACGTRVRIVPTSAFGSVVRNAKMSLVVSPSLALRTDVQLVQIPAKQARGAAFVEGEPDVAAPALLNSLKELNGTTQRFSVPSQRVQCLLFTLRILVVPPSGSIFSNCWKSTLCPWRAACRREPWRP